MLILTKNNLVLDTDDMLFEEADEAYLKHALELGVFDISANLQAEILQILRS